LAHVCSSDLAIPALAPFCAPLIARGWDVTMITPDGPHVARRPPGMAWRPLALRRRMHLASDVAGTLQLARYFLGGRYDIMHSHNIKAGHIARVVAAATRIPLIVHTIHGMAYSLETPWLKRTAHAALERIASLDCDLVLVQSQEDLDSLLATHVVGRNKLRLIGNGIDLARFDPGELATTRMPTRRSLGIADDEIVFLSAGRLIREKGFVELFEAAASARRHDPRIRLVVAGPTDERSDALDPELLDDARGDGVLLLGQRADMPELYAASDVVVLASWHEGMPRVLIEGAVMGKPLLTNDVRGCREIVKPPNNGLIVPVRDADALARAMITLAGDPSLRTRLGRANASEARERYDIQRAVGLVVEAYDDLLARRARR
jgi:glycosyltransferase involved in cell wall biosynthesis